MPPPAPPQNGFSHPPACAALTARAPDPRSRRPGFRHDHRAQQQQRRRQQRQCAEDAVHSAPGRQHAAKINANCRADSQRHADKRKESRQPPAIKRIPQHRLPNHRPDCRAESRHDTSRQQYAKIWRASASIQPAVYTARPSNNAGRRPRRSLNQPQNSTPTAKPIK